MTATTARTANTNTPRADAAISPSSLLGIPTGRAQLEWVPIAKMAYLPGIAQRAKIEWGWVAQIAADFDPDELDHPTVSARDNCYFVADGMHRVEALKQIGWGDQQIQCWTYTGLDETGEADLFLGLNNRRAVSALDRFSSAITAGRTVETDINQIVAEADLAISGQKTGIKAVATLRKVYERSGPHALSRALAILRDAYGTSGLDGPVIEGLGLVTARYNGDLDDTELTRCLQAAPGGVTGLTSAAEQLRLKTGHQRAHCLAAAAVEIHNRHRGGKKLPNWWRNDS